MRFETLSKPAASLTADEPLGHFIVPPAQTTLRPQTTPDNSPSHSFLLRRPDVRWLKDPVPAAECAQAMGEFSREQQGRVAWTEDGESRL